MDNDIATVCGQWFTAGKYTINLQKIQHIEWGIIDQEIRGAKVYTQEVCIVLRQTAANALFEMVVEGKEE